MCIFFKNLIGNLRNNYNEYKEEIIDETIVLQQKFSKYNILIFALYAAFIISMERNLKSFFIHILMCILCVLISYINYYMFTNFMDRYKPKAIMIGNIYITILITILVFVDAFFSNEISYTIVFGGIFITSISNLVPISYSAILIISLFFDTVMHSIINNSVFSSFFFVLLDNSVIAIMVICINYTLSNAKYAEFKYRKELKQENNTDFLTKLLNRRYIENYVYSQAKHKEKVAMVLIDLDNFKPVNDLFGHRKGDELLVNVSDIIRDSFGKTDCIARLGGDEFLVYVPKIDDTISLVNKVENFSKKFPIVVSADNKEVRVSASIGVAFSKNNERDLYEELYKRADDAMYKAKNSGKGKYYISN